MLVTFCLLFILMAHHQYCLIQPNGFVVAVPVKKKSWIEMIHNRAAMCNINIPQSHLFLCNSKLVTDPTDSDMPMLCAGLYGKIDSFCNIKREGDIILSDNSPDLNESTLCSAMKSEFSSPWHMPENDLGIVEHWIPQLQDRFSTIDKCKNICFKDNIVNPLCFDMYQLHEHSASSSVTDKGQTISEADKPETHLPKHKNDKIDNDKKLEPVALSEVSKKASTLPPVALSEVSKKASTLPHGEVHLTSKNSPQSSNAVNSDKENNAGIHDIAVGGTGNESDFEITQNKAHLLVSLPTVLTGKLGSSSTVAENSLPEEIPPKSDPPQSRLSLDSPDLDTGKDDAASSPRANPEDTKQNAQEMNKQADADFEAGKDNTPSNANHEDTIQNAEEMNKEADANFESGKDNTANIANPEDTKQDAEEMNKQATSDTEENNPEPKSPLAQTVVEDSVDGKSTPKESNLKDQPKQSSENNTKNIGLAHGMEPEKSGIADNEQTAGTEGPETRPEVEDSMRTDDYGDHEDEDDVNIGSNGNRTPDDFVAESDTLKVVSHSDQVNVEDLKNVAIRPDRFVNAEDSHFFAYFMSMVIICIIGYLVFHNKQKILALALEGRSRRGTRRRPNTSGYRKLDSNLEEAVTSACSTSVTHVIY